MSKAKGYTSVYFSKGANGSCGLSRGVLYWFFMADVRDALASNYLFFSCK